MSDHPSPLPLARRLVEVDQPRQALDALARAGGDELEDPEYWVLQAAANFDLEDYARSADAAREGLARDAGDPHLLYVLAIAEAGRGDVPAAETAILSALTAAPEDARLLCAYARIAAQANQLAKADRLADRAEQVDHNEPELIHTRALLAFLRGRDRKAAAFAEQALADDPDDGRAHRMRGAALLHQRRFRGADSSFSSAVRDDPSDHSLASAARSVRAAGHPLMWPVLPLQMLGPAGSWIAAMALIFGSRAAGLTTLSAIATIVWLVVVVYSWTIAPLAARHLERRGP